jgi:hypothetical protein
LFLRNSDTALCADQKSITRGNLTLSLHNSFNKRHRFIPAFIITFALICLAQNSQDIFAYTSGTGVLAPADYATFRPPSPGGSYTDAVFGSGIKRISNSMATNRSDSGGMVQTILPEYSTMSPFNNDNSKLILEHFSYFGLYDGAGNYVKDLPLEINSSSEPRWSRKDPNVLYYVRGNQLKQHNVGTGATSVVHQFSEYSAVKGNGESDISFDGNYFVLQGDNREVFLYNIASDAKGQTLDTGGRGFDSLYVTPDNNVTVTYERRRSSCLGECSGSDPGL